MHRTPGGGLMAPRRSAALCALPRLELAIAWIRGVDPPTVTRRDDLERRSHQRLGAFIAHHMHVPAACIDEARSCRAPDGCAAWIVTVIDGCRSRLDQHHTGTRVRMPAAVAAGRDGVGHHIDIRGFFRNDPYFRVLALAVCPAENSNLLEERSGDITDEILGCRGQCGTRPTEHGRYATNQGTSGRCIDEPSCFGAQTAAFPSLHCSNDLHLRAPHEFNRQA